MNKTDLSEIDVPLARTGAQKKALREETKRQREIDVMKTIATRLLTQPDVFVEYEYYLSEIARNHLHEKGYIMRRASPAVLHVYPIDWEFDIWQPHPPDEGGCCIIL